MPFKQYTYQDILEQLKLDLIGKDSHRGVSFTYSWLANQFGHFSLGFIPTLLLFPLFRNTIKGSIYAAVLVTSVWVVFEAYNFLGPLLLKSSSKSKIMYVPSTKEYNFPPSWYNIGFDTLTDIGFFALGAFSAALAIETEPITVVILASLSLALLYPVLFWFTVKMSLQDAKYPMQFRLSQWDLKISEENKKKVNLFLSSSLGRPSHLFVFGGGNSGKSSLGVGIATEHSNKHARCVYITGMKLYGMCSIADDMIKSNYGSKWTWRDCSLLVIDDINPGLPVDDLIEAQKFSEILSAHSNTSAANLEAIINKKIIWITGIHKADDKQYMSWKRMLTDLGARDSDITTIDLNDCV